MFREQVYNTSGWEKEHPTQTSETQRRLNRRINHNMGLLNTSRNSSNHSGSFRMRRTQLSGERFNMSRDRDQTSQQISGLISQEINESQRQIPKKIGSLLSLSRRKLVYDTTKVSTGSRSGKNIVQNLYMLTNNVPQHQQYQQQYQQPQPQYQQSQPQYQQPQPQYQQPQPQYQQRQQQQYQQPVNDKRQRSNRQQNQEPQSPRSHTRHLIQNERKREDSSQNSKEPGGSQTRLSRGSLMRNRNSRDKSRRGGDKSDSSRGRYYKDGTEKQKNTQPDREIRKLEQKYLQNVYELNSPKEKRNREIQAENKRRSEKIIQNNSRNMNQYYFQGQMPSLGVKTMPEVSNINSISEASLPVHSVASQRQTSSKKEISPQMHKMSVKLDRPKQKNKKKEQFPKQQSAVSSLSMRWKMNNVQLQQRNDDKPITHKQKIIDDPSEHDDVMLPTGSVFLPVQSKREEGREWAEDILERIILHLESLNIIADYTKEFKKMYENVQPWEILIFLSYKKFYIERTKVTNILKSYQNKNRQFDDFQQRLDSVDNPFILPYSKVTGEQLNRFKNTKECIALKFQLQTQNTKIRNALRGLYNLYIQKSGQHVNMLDCDNFSQQIYKTMLQQLDGISQNLEDQSLIMPTKLRMGKIIKVGLMIAYLNGKYVKNFAQILLHQDIIKVGKRQTIRQDCISQLFMSEFKRVLS